MVIRTSLYSNKDSYNEIYESQINTIDAMIKESCVEFNNDTKMISIREGQLSDIIYGFLGYLKRFIVFLGNMTDKFRSAFSTLVKNDLFIIKSKDDIINYNPGSNAVITKRYIYTYLEDSLIPDPNPHVTKMDLYMYNVKFFKDSLYFDKKNRIDGIRKENEKMEDPEERENYLRLFRSAVFNKNNFVSGEAYIDFCNKCYRNDKDSAELNGVVPYEEMQDIFSRFLKYDKITTSINQTYKNLINEYNKVLSGFQKKASEIKYFDNAIQFSNKDELETEMRRFYQNKADLIQEATQIHLTAFSAKLNAIKERYSSDRNILLRCIDNVVKGRHE